MTVNRCEALRTLILDAPYLTNLRVDHCFNLDNYRVPASFNNGGPLKVSSRGAYLGGTARRNLRAHPRSVRADDDQDAARSVFPLASYAHEDHSGQAARALNGRSSGCKAWWDSESDGESDVGDSDDEDEPEAVRDFRRMMAFVMHAPAAAGTKIFCCFLLLADLLVNVRPVPRLALSHYCWRWEQVRQAGFYGPICSGTRKNPWLPWSVREVAACAGACGRPRRGTTLA